MSSANLAAEFMGVVGLGKRYVVAVFLGKTRHHFVQHEGDVHADAEIGCVKQALVFLEATLAHFVKPVVPRRGAHHDGQVQFEAAVDVVHGLVGEAEFNGDIGLPDLFQTVFPVVEVVDASHDLVLLQQRHALKFVSHFAVS